MIKSPQMIIIRVPDNGSSNDPKALSTSSLPDTEMNLLRMPLPPTISIASENYPKCTKNRPNLDEIVTQLGSSNRRTSFTDDKYLRKKLKNRVAAQNSRDKKKARMDELERLVVDLQRKNESVTQECERLKTEVATLKAENVELKQKSCNCGKAISSWPVEPAAFINDPLQKGQGHSLLTFLFLLSHILRMKLQTPTCSKLSSWQKESLVRELKSLKVENGTFQKLTPSQCSVQVKWWGRQQKTWNPVDG